MTLISMYICIYGPIHVEEINELNLPLFLMQMWWFYFIISCLVIENFAQKLATCFDNPRGLYLLKTSLVISVPYSTRYFEIRLSSHTKW